jgi:putative SOS response-associated peptidase YedK
MKQDHPFAFAGLAEWWRGADSSELESCTIITTDANALLRPIYDRMPVILPDDDYPQWLDPKLDEPAVLGALLRSYPPEEMTAYPISTLVNSLRNDSAACIERAI